MTKEFDKIIAQEFSQEGIHLWEHHYAMAITIYAAARSLEIQDPTTIKEAATIHRRWKSWLEKHHGVQWGWGGSKEKKPLVPPKEKKKPVRIKVFGHPVTHVLKWMGANGWADRFDDAALAICTVADNYKISDWTIKLQLRAGKKIADPNDWDTLNKRNQKLIELDKEQIQELEDAIL